jgi:pimeloyl-ACP methyl ester carboxylesterase
MRAANKTKIKKGKIVFVIVAVVLLIIITTTSVYIYRCLNYWQKDYKNTLNAGFIEKEVVLPDGSIINYAEGPNSGSALLLIHGQTGAWQDYSRVLPELSKNWHVFVVDCYGHGQSSHDETKYYLKDNGDDLIWFVNEIIGKPSVVSGHSSGGLLASYVVAYGGELIIGAVLEDPPVFSTEMDYFEKTFAYQDTYKTMHEYTTSEQTECWEAYYLRHCLWGQLYMASSMNGIANYVNQYHTKNPNKPVQIFFMPESINYIFLYSPKYDFAFGGHFYDYTWHSGINHEKLMGDINVPAIFLHNEENFSDDGILMAASTNAQAEKAVALIGNCELIRINGNHNIHRFNSKVLINAVNRLHEY